MHSKPLWTREQHSCKITDSRTTDTIKGHVQAVLAKNVTSVQMYVGVYTLSSIPKLFVNIVDDLSFPKIVVLLVIMSPGKRSFRILFVFLLHVSRAQISLVSLVAPTISLLTSFVRSSSSRASISHTSLGVNPFRSRFLLEPLPVDLLNADSSDTQSNISNDN